MAQELILTGTLPKDVKLPIPSFSLGVSENDFQREFMDYMNNLCKLLEDHEMIDLVVVDGRNNKELNGKIPDVVILRSKPENIHRMMKDAVFIIELKCSDNRLKEASSCGQVISISTL